MDEQKFREEIVRELRLDKLGPERQDALIDKAVTVLLERIFLATMEKLGDAGVSEYEKLLENEAAPDEIQAFLESRISGYNEFVQKIVSEFTEEMKQAHI